MAPLRSWYSIQDSICVFFETCPWISIMLPCSCRTCERAHAKVVAVAEIKEVNPPQALLDPDDLAGDALYLAFSVEGEAIGAGKTAGSRRASEIYWSATSLRTESGSSCK